MTEHAQAPAPRGKRLAYAIIAGALCLVLLIVSLALGAQNRSLRAFDEGVLLSLTRQLQSELVLSLRTYDGINKSGADFDGEILPEVRRHLNTSEVVNQILLDGWGANYGVLESDFTSRLDHFYQEYSLAIEAERPVADAMAMLDACMHDLENVVLTRFEANGRLILK